jgi:hypothetical protein
VGGVIGLDKAPYRYDEFQSIDMIMGDKDPDSMVFGVLGMSKMHS